MNRVLLALSCILSPAAHLVMSFPVRLAPIVDVTMWILDQRACRRAMVNIEALRIVGFVCLSRVINLHQCIAAIVIVESVVKQALAPATFIRIRFLQVPSCICIECASTGRPYHRESALGLVSLRGTSSSR